MKAVILNLIWDTMRVWSRYGVVFILLIFWNVIYAEDTDDEFEMMDGIKVRKDSIKNETSGVYRKGKKEGQRGKDSEENDDDQDDDDDDDDEEDEDDDQDDSDEDEDLESIKHLPTKCHGNLKRWPL